MNTMAIVAYGLSSFTLGWVLASAFIPMRRDYLMYKTLRKGHRVSQRLQAVAAALKALDASTPEQ